MKTNTPPPLPCLVEPARLTALAGILILLAAFAPATLMPTPAQAANALTVHDLINEPKTPPQYGDFVMKTSSGVRLDQIVDASGLTRANHGGTGLAQPDVTYWNPVQAKGATVTVRHIGEWLGGDSRKHWVNAKFTIVDSNQCGFYFTAGKGAFGVHANESNDPNMFMDYTVDFMLDDGNTPQGFRGITGFSDLDWNPNTKGAEGIELVEGFDNAYVRSDAHLTRFGTNGWRATTDENYDYSGGIHAMRHYVGATFVGAHLRVRYSNTSRSSYDSQFDPIQAQTAYRLIYDANGGQGDLPRQTN